MTDGWYKEALRLAAEYAACKGALDVAHVLGDARLYAGQMRGEKMAWSALQAHLRLAAPQQP